MVYVYIYRGLKKDCHLFKGSGFLAVLLTLFLFYSRSWNWPFPAEKVVEELKVTKWYSLGQINTSRIQILRFAVWLIQWFCSKGSGCLFTQVQTSYGEIYPFCSVWHTSSVWHTFKPSTCSILLYATLLDLQDLVWSERHMWRILIYAKIAFTYNTPLSTYGPLPG